MRQPPTDSREPPPEEAQAGKAPKPGPVWLEDRPYLRAFLEGLRQPSTPPDPQRNQVSIFDMLLVTLIAAVVLGILGMVPGGYSALSAGFGLVFGCLVLGILRPRAAIGRLARWAVLGWMTAVLMIPRCFAAARLFWSFLMLFILIRFLRGQEDSIVERYRSFVPALVILFAWAIVFPGSANWVPVPEWLPMALYLLATVVGAWRLWGPQGERPPPRSP